MPNLKPYLQILVLSGYLEFLLIYQCTFCDQKKTPLLTSTVFQTNR